MGEPTGERSDTGNSVVKGMVPEDAEQMPRLSKTLTGLKLQKIMSGVTHDKVPDGIQEIAGLIAAWDGLKVDSYVQLDKVLQKARTCVQTSHREAFCRQLQSSSQAFKDLQLRAGGTETGKNWKAALPDGASWDDVCAVASKTVLKDTPFHKMLDKYFSAAEKSLAQLKEAMTWQGLPAEAQQARDLLVQEAELFQLARLTGTEIFFLETILMIRPDKQKARLKKRHAPGV